jgi:hypothetical protein
VVTQGRIAVRDGVPVEVLNAAALAAKGGVAGSDATTP